jgi:multimeric flavodoxin WrbA
MKKVIERLYLCSSLLNDRGQYAYYGRVGGCLSSSRNRSVDYVAINDNGQANIPVGGHFISLSADS